mgnify:CR=1 FL=1
MLQVRPRCSGLVAAGQKHLVAGVQGRARHWAQVDANHATRAPPFSSLVPGLT